MLWVSNLILHNSHIILNPFGGLLILLRRMQSVTSRPRPKIEGVVFDIMRKRDCEEKNLLHHNMAFGKEKTTANTE